MRQVNIQHHNIGARDFQYLNRDGHLRDKTGQMHALSLHQIRSTFHDQNLYILFFYIKR